MSANEFAELFNAAHGEYSAALIDGVFVIRPVEKPANFLDMPAAIPPQMALSGPTAAATQLFLPLNPLLNGPVLNAVPENTRVVLDGGTSVLRALNQIVKQTRTTWFVVTRKTRDRWTPVEFGFISQGAQRDTRGILSRSEHAPEGPDRTIHARRVSRSPGYRIVSTVMNGRLFIASLIFPI